MSSIYEQICDHLMFKSLFLKLLIEVKSPWNFYLIFSFYNAESDRPCDC
jgi:hypothetical protein